MVDKFGKYQVLLSGSEYEDLLQEEYRENIEEKYTILKRLMEFPDKELEIPNKLELDTSKFHKVPFEFDKKIVFRGSVSYKNSDYFTGLSNLITRYSILNKDLYTSTVYSTMNEYFVSKRAKFLVTCKDAAIVQFSSFRFRCTHTYIAIIIENEIVWLTLCNLNKVLRGYDCFTPYNDNINPIDNGLSFGELLNPGDMIYAYNNNKNPSTINNKLFPGSYNKLIMRLLQRHTIVLGSYRLGGFYPVPEDESRCRLKEICLYDPRYQVFIICNCEYTMIAGVADIEALIVISKYDFSEMPEGYLKELRNACDDDRNMRGFLLEYIEDYLDRAKKYRYKNLSKNDYTLRLADALFNNGIDGISKMDNTFRNDVIHKLKRMYYDEIEEKEVDIPQDFLKCLIPALYKVGECRANNTCDEVLAPVKGRLFNINIHTLSMIYEDTPEEFNKSIYGDQNAYNEILKLLISSKDGMVRLSAVTKDTGKVVKTIEIFRNLLDAFLLYDKIRQLEEIGKIHDKK